ncbi:hypothetical protein DVH05_016961 [Phytophthora capsici]|nr:hypothetical protein DVH05_016961 [Phytophthora capsici]
MFTPGILSTAQSCTPRTPSRCRRPLPLERLRYLHVEGVASRIMKERWADSDLDAAASIWIGNWDLLPDVDVLWLTQLSYQPLSSCEQQDSGDDIKRITFIDGPD